MVGDTAQSMAKTRSRLLTTFLGECDRPCCSRGCRPHDAATATAVAMAVMVVLPVAIVTVRVAVAVVVAVVVVAVVVGVIFKKMHHTPPSSTGLCG